MYLIFSEIIDPHSAWGRAEPRPKNDRPARDTIMVAMCREIVTIKISIIFGRIWKNMILISDSPEILDEIT